jgi:hypothetical protein
VKLVRGDGPRSGPSSISPSKFFFWPFRYFMGLCNLRVYPCRIWLSAVAHL